MALFLSHPLQVRMGERAGVTRQAFRLRRVRRCRFSRCSDVPPTFAKGYGGRSSKSGASLYLLLGSFSSILANYFFAHVKTLWVLPLLIFVPAIWGFALIVFQDFVQKLISSDRRATVLSIMSFFRRGIFFVFVPFLGWVTDVYSIQTAFLCSAVIVFVFSVVSLLSLRMVKVI